VLWRGLRLAGPGSVLGAAAAWASGRLLESRLYGVETGDPATLAGAVAVLVGAATPGVLAARAARCGHRPAGDAARGMT
jgi:hypothetical protein